MQLFEGLARPVGWVSALTYTGGGVRDEGVLFAGSASFTALTGLSGDRIGIFRISPAAH
jgi:hypothetical protein